MSALNRLSVALFKWRWVRERWARRFRPPRPEGIPWTPLPRPLAQCRVALVSTGGVHLRRDPPFDMTDPDGDPGLRVIPADSPAEALAITDIYYDHRDADHDLNLVLPLQRLREAARDGRIGSAAPSAFSLMGHLLGEKLETLRTVTVPALLHRLREEAVDVVLLVPA
jgi:D-proline reductase (dithiol) PrdB